MTIIMKHDTSEKVVGKIILLCTIYTTKYRQKQYCFAVKDRGLTYTYYDADALK